MWVAEVSLGCSEHLLSRWAVSIPPGPSTHLVSPSQAPKCLQKGLPEYVIVLQLLEKGDFPDGGGWHALLLSLQPGPHGGFRGRKVGDPQPASRWAISNPGPRIAHRSPGPPPAPNLLESEEPVCCPIMGPEDHAVRALPDLGYLVVLRRSKHETETQPTHSQVRGIAALVDAARHVDGHCGDRGRTGRPARGPLTQQVSSRRAGPIRARGTLSVCTYAL